jgi:hypothetical protein
LNVEIVSQGVDEEAWIGVEDTRQNESQETILEFSISVFVFKLQCGIVHVHFIVDHGVVELEVSGESTLKKLYELLNYITWIRTKSLLNSIQLFPSELNVNGRILPGDGKMKYR